MSQTSYYGYIEVVLLNESTEKSTSFKYINAASSSSDTFDKNQKSSINKNINWSTRFSLFSLEMFWNSHCYYQNLRKAISTGKTEFILINLCSGNALSDQLETFELL